MDAKRRLLELLLSPDAPAWRVRRIVVEEHGREDGDDRSATLRRVARLVRAAKHDARRDR